jgi:hypothetical protein
MRFASLLAFGVFGFQSLAFGSYVHPEKTDYVCGDESASVTIQKTRWGRTLRCEVTLANSVSGSAENCWILATDPVFAAFAVAFSDDEVLLATRAGDCEEVLALDDASL